MQEHLFSHYNSDAHNSLLKNVFITLIDKSVGNDPKKRENYWRRIFKSNDPLGLNVEDSFWPIPLSIIKVTNGLTNLVQFGILVVSAQIVTLDMI